MASCSSAWFVERYLFHCRGRRCRYSEDSKELIEKRGTESGAWRGDVAPEIRGSLSDTAFRLLDDTATRVLREKQAWWLTAGFALGGGCELALDPAQLVLDGLEPRPGPLDVLLRGRGAGHRRHQ